MYKLKLIYGPTIEPVTVEDVKIHTHIGSDVAEDGIILSWIKSGRELAEAFQRRAFIKQTWEMSFDKYPSSPFYIPRPPLINIVSVKYYDTNNVEYVYDFASNWIVDYAEPAMVSLQYQLAWPGVTLRTLNSFIIRFNAGYSSSGESLTTTEAPDSSHVPDYIKDAVYLYCTYRYENRAGEVTKIPDQFYNLLEHDRIFQPY